METPHDYKLQVGSRIKMAIEIKGLTQAEVADTLGVSASRLGHWLNGRHFPKPFELTRFCERYNITMDWIYRAKLSAAMDRALEDALWKASGASPAALSEASDPVPEKPARKARVKASAPP